MPAAKAEKDALLTNPGIEAKQELTTLIASLTGYSSVMLSDKDLTETSYLTIERNHQSDNKGNLLQGRDIEMPHRFQLILQDQACWLVYQNTGQRSLLSKAQCKAK
ncbi:hypothetical protein [Undibacterium sp. Xuan67W]|uniref:hypothetical protein n=1 Tax=Undibacterium sp. Xuan67W TaxID=3413057 RepID=UPI003BF34AD5